MQELNEWQWLVCICAFGLLPNFTHLYLSYRQKQNRLDSSWRNRLPKQVVWWMNVSSMIYGISGLSFIPTIDVIQWVMIGCVLWVMGMIVWSDLWLGIIPNICVGIMLIVGVLEQIRNESYQEYLLSEWMIGFLIFSLFVVLIWITNAMGWGDVKLFMVLLIWLGIWNWMMLLWLASMSACGWVMIRSLVTKQSIRRLKISFGPHIVLGAVIIWTIGETMWNRYLEWFLSF